MKIVIFGASGKTGNLLVNQALTSGHQVTAYVRRLGALAQQHPNLKIVTGELSDSVKLTEVISGSDACISALGGGSITKHAPEVITGIRNIVQTMEYTGVNRFVYLSSIGVNESHAFMAPLIRFFIVDVLLKVPMADHSVNERTIFSSKLQWTVVRPVSLYNGPVTSNLKHGSEKMRLTQNVKISRASVACFMLEQLNDNTYLQKAAWLYE